MRAKWMILTTLVVLLAGMTLSVFVMNTSVQTDADPVAVNEIVKITENRWGHLRAEDYGQVTRQFTVLDNQGNILYQTGEGLSATLNDAIKNRDAVADIIVDGTLTGKVMVHNDFPNIVKHTKQRLMLVIMTTFLVLTLLCALYALFLNRTMIKPFRKLQSFAVHVAKGNLDIPLNMDANNPFGAFTESFDIMREELAAARQSEYEANRSKKELVATLSHDIKTPVASIKAVSELMLLRASDDKAIKQLNTIYSKAEQINLLVTDMFHATLEELRELKVAVAEEPSGILHGMISQVNYDDRIRCSPIPECLVFTDSTRLQQVLDNILSNSYKYAGTAINITSYLTRTHLELHIMDYGNGVDEEELPLLFNKFYRGNNAEGRGGSGLGLYISKYFMQKMMGDIECHNRNDGFTVVLKIKLV